MKRKRLYTIGLLGLGAVLSFAKVALAHDLKVTDTKGSVIVVKDAGIDYTPGGIGLVTVDRESEGIRVYQGQGKVLLKWTDVDAVTIIAKDTTTTPYRFKAEIVLASGKKLAADLQFDGRRGLYGKTELGDFSIDLEDVRTIEPIKSPKKP